MQTLPFSMVGAWLQLNGYSTPTHLSFANISGGIFVALLISMVIGASLISTIANSTKAATANANVTGGAKDLTTLLPLVFVAAVIIRSVKEGIGE